MKSILLLPVVLSIGFAISPPGSRPPPDAFEPVRFEKTPRTPGPPGTTFLTGPFSGETCPDNHPGCTYWADKGECGRNPNWMKANCQKSCRSCSYSCTECECFDDHHWCWWWAQDNHCRINPDYMLRNCKKSCNNCPGALDFEGNVIRGALPDEEEAQEGSETEGKKKIKKKGPEGPPLAATDCEDESINCAYWAERGECGEHPYFMKIRCQKSCETCGMTYEDLGKPEPIPGCVNEHPLCEFWKAMGNCEKGKFAPYMKSNCKLSCGTC